MNNPIPGRRLPGRQQRGFALLTGLILLVVATLVVLTSMRGTVFQESMTASVNNKSLALMAAESGATMFLDTLDAHVQNDPENWPFKTSDNGDAPSIQQLSAMNLFSGMHWSNDDVAAPDDDAVVGTFANNSFTTGFMLLDPVFTPISGRSEMGITVRVVGRVANGPDPENVLARSAIEVSLSPPVLPEDLGGLMLPAALTLGGQVEEFSGGNSNQFYLTGEGVNTPSIGVDSNFPGGAATVLDGIPSNRLTNHGGGATEMNFGPLWGRPESLQQLVNRAEDEPSAIVIDGNATMDPNGRIWNDDGVRVATFRSNHHDLLIVKGDLTWDGNVKLDGILMVLGENFTWNGGGNSGVDGGVYLANIDTSGDDWTFGTGGVNFNGGGQSGVQYNGETVRRMTESLLAMASIGSWREVMP